MNQRSIRLVVLLGIIAIVGIISIQVYWLSTAYNLKERQFNETIHIALLNVAENMATLNNGSLANEDVVNQLSNDYFVVNVNDIIDANVLEYYLTNEFEKLQIDLDFEYAIYDCASDNMLYGSYISLDDNKKIEPSTDLPTYDEFIYYFGVKFPTKAQFVIANLRLGLVFTGILLVALAFFGYAIYVILAQKRISELQTDFINNMTHEFKTPISSIGLSADVLLKNEHFVGNERLTNYATIIKEQTDRLNNQVEKVLQIAKIQQNELLLNKEKLNVVDLIESVRRSAVLNYEKKGGNIQFNSNVPELEIEADKLHFTNIIFNILDNSLKYNTNKPEAIINLQQLKKHIVLTISDNGIGIEKQHLALVFDRFYRVPTGDLHNVKGFGLGMFYVKNIVEQHQWKISIDSEIGVGTTIKIKL